jgi:hypothetical protein
MDVREYCSKMDRQLSGWKAYIDEVIQAARGLPASEGTALAPMIARLQPLLSAIEAELELLKSSCPADWAPQRRQVDERMQELYDTLKTLSQKVKGPLIPDSLSWVSH